MYYVIFVVLGLILGMLIMKIVNYVKNDMYETNFIIYTKIIKSLFEYISNIQSVHSEQSKKEVITLIENVLINVYKNENKYSFTGTEDEISDIHDNATKFYKLVMDGKDTDDKG